MSEVEGHYEGEVLDYDWNNLGPRDPRVIDYESQYKIQERGGFVKFFAVVPIGEEAPLPEDGVASFDSEKWIVSLPKDSIWQDYFPFDHQYDLEKHDIVTATASISRTFTEQPTLSGENIRVLGAWNIRWDIDGRTKRAKELRILIVCGEFKKDEDIPLPQVVGYDYENDKIHFCSGTQWERFRHGFIAQTRNPEWGVYVSMCVTDMNGFPTLWATPIPFGEFWRALHEDGKLRPEPHRQNLCKPAQP